MSSAPLLKELHDLGFTPISSICIVAVITLWGFFIVAVRNNAVTREKWHRETQGRVELMNEHVDECNEDREVLHGRIAEQNVQIGTQAAQIDHLSEKVQRLTSCPRKNCPLRLP